MLSRYSVRENKRIEQKTKRLAHSAHSICIVHMCVCFARAFNGTPIRLVPSLYSYEPAFVFTQEHRFFRCLPVFLSFQTNTHTLCKQNALLIQFLVEIECLHSIGDGKCMRFIASMLHIQHVKLDDIDTHCITIYEKSCSIQWKIISFVFCGFECSVCGEKISVLLILSAHSYRLRIQFFVLASHWMKLEVSCMEYWIITTWSWLLLDCSIMLPIHPNRKKNIWNILKITSNPKANTLISSPVNTS